MSYQPKSIFEKKLEEKADLVQWIMGITGVILILLTIVVLAMYW